MQGIQRNTIDSKYVFMATHLILLKSISCSKHPPMADFIWKI